MVNYCLALPFLPGGEELAKKFAQENGHTEEHDEFYRIAGISSEHVWIQRSPRASGAPDLDIVSIETNDPANTQRICYLRSSMGHKVSRFCKESLWYRLFGSSTTTE